MGFPPALLGSAVSVGEGALKEIFVLNGHCGWRENMSMDLES